MANPRAAGSRSGRATSAACNGTTELTNVPNAELWGGEIEASYENDRIRLGLGYSHINGENEDTGDYLGSLAPEQVTADAGLKLPEIDSIVGWRVLAAAEFDKVNDPEDARDGYITLRGRRSDVVISGGFNIYPREIEELLVEHPTVAEAAVVGAADPVRGEVPVAFVVPRPGTVPDPETLSAFCRDHLASFKTPRRVIVVDRLPRTALGKVQKNALKSRL